MEEGGLSCLVILSILVTLASLFDAWTTYNRIKDGSHESWWLRKFLINALGLKDGTFGVAIAQSIVIFVINISFAMTPTLVFMNIVAIIFPAYAGYSNLESI